MLFCWCTSTKACATALDRKAALGISPHSGNKHPAQSPLPIAAICAHPDAVPPPLTCRFATHNAPPPSHLKRYRFFSHSPLLGAMQLETEFDWGGTRIIVTTCVVEGLRCFFIEPRNGMFDSDAVYGGRGDDVKFDFFCRVRARGSVDVMCHAWVRNGACVPTAFMEPSL